MTASLAQLAEVPYRPSRPKSYAPRIGMIGCGGITREHLRAYRAAGFQLTALCDVQLPRARAAAEEFYPQADVYEDYRELLRDESIEVVDVTTHPAERLAIIDAALRADKHVLSQKPFVLNLDDGERLIELAEQCGKVLAVNQNGRWAPHFSYARQAASSGCLGDVFAAHLGCHWDHSWVAGTAFEKVKHLILYDYAIHWFDIVRCFFAPKPPRRVFASTARVPGQNLQPQLLGQALIEFEEGQATLAFDAGVPHGQLDQTYLAGTLGSLHSRGPSIQQQQLTLTTAQGSWSPALHGQWFPDAFQGTMGEVLCAIEERRECSINARDNLHSLALCFAAVASAERGQAVIPGSIRQLPT
ncbi:MAG: Gfo/Idh/MocA family oxidoreductase [Planctomycetales bacterium]|nr:Gfo/Idh/MocA family oxidoreductase [Planctomycetales bacterium]